MSNADNLDDFRNLLEHTRAELANCPREDGLRDVMAQCLALWEELMRDASGDDWHAKVRAVNLFEFRLRRFLATWNRWLLAGMPQPDHFAPRFLKHIAYMRRKLRAE
jgi:hypothetical protein